MIVRNDCVKEDTITVELNGYCSPITDILSQQPVIDCDNILVCIGPYFVNLETLITEVQHFIQDSNNTTLNNIHLLYQQYQSLYEYFMKCCITMNDKLNNIQNRLDKMVIIKEIVVKPPTYNYPKSNKPKFVAPLPRPQIIIEESYVVDQTLVNGYIDSFKIYTYYGYTTSQYVMWLISGNKRKLIPKDVPYRIGTPEANGFITEIINIFNSYNLTLNFSEIKYQRFR